MNSRRGRMASSRQRPSDPPGRSVAAVERRAISLPADLMLRADSALFELRKRRQRVSFSGLVEAALLELLDRADLDGILKRRGASARRRKAP